MRVCDVNGLRLGEGGCKICVPFFGRNEAEVLASASAAVGSCADLFEWRCDYLDFCEGNLGGGEEGLPVSDYLERLERVWEKIEKLMQGRPVLLTYRSKGEGGEGPKHGEAYAGIVEWAAQKDFPVVDIELSCGDLLCRRLVSALHNRGAKALFSAHFFSHTPSDEEMDSLFDQMEKAGADVAKLAVMPNERKDVLRLMQSCLSASGRLSCPVAAMSMGKLGAVSRLSGGLCGSAITFAAAKEASAPGQMSAQSVRQVLDLLD